MLMRGARGGGKEAGRRGREGEEEGERREKSDVAL